MMIYMEQDLQIISFKNIKNIKKNPSSIQPMSISDYIKLKNTPEYKKETEKYTKKTIDDFLKLVK